MSDTPIYLDFAATAAIRPPEVAAAVSSYIEAIGATPGRGNYRSATEAGRLALRCRMAVARLLGIPGDPGRIAWMLNATHALNTALFGTLRSDDVVVTTSFDHNAVLRPAHALGDHRRVHVRMVRGERDGTIDLQACNMALGGARLLVINAASNVLGTRLPIRELADLAHEAGALVLLDAAQLAGHGDIDVERDGIDLLAFTGHKGLLGPQGIGGLWVREGVRVDPLLSGGTGGNSLDPKMPEAYPDHLEAGTQNAPGIAGLLAGIEWIQRRTPAALQAHGSALKVRLWDGLDSVAGVNVLSPRAPDGVPVVTITAAGTDPSELARRLDVEHGISARAGLHCAPEVHRLLGTESTGALRFSAGWCTTEEDIDRTITAVARVVDAGTTRAQRNAAVTAAPGGAGG
jgi:cysteine desulfurase/selenocysteine lyase